MIEPTPAVPPNVVSELMQKIANVYQVPVWMLTGQGQPKEPEKQETTCAHD